MKSLLLLTSLLLSGANSLAQEVKQSFETRKVVAWPATSVQPASGFSVNSSLTTRLKLIDGPVRIVSLGEGMLMSSVVIRNDSANQVNAIRLDWYLFDNATSTNEVKKGRTKLIKLGRLAVGEIKTIESNIPEFDEMFGSLAKDGFIGGTYFLEATVGAIEFSDGTTWTREGSSLPDRSASEKPALLTFTDLQKNDSVAGSFRIEGYVIDTYKCPPCPPGAMCKPCDSNNIVITDDIEQKDPSKINRIRIYTDRLEQFELKKKYSFLVKIKGKVPAGQTIHDVSLVSFEPTAKP